MIIPSPASPARNANKPRPKTIIPADLKNKSACFECAKEIELNERSASIGSVPNANENIINNPDINDPLESAATCIDCVNPHGKKNVPKPIRNGAQNACSILLKKAKIWLGKVSEFFLKIPSKFIPSIIITIEAKSPSIAEKIKFIPIACPSNPRIPPSKPKPNNLPI